MCVQGARGFARRLVRNLRQEPSLLVLVFLLFTVLFGLNYQGGIEPLLLLLGAIVLAYSRRTRQAVKSQEHLDEQIKRIQYETYIGLGIALVLSNLDFEYNRPVAIFVATITLLYFAYRIGDATPKNH